ncbi:MAG TPA: YdcH family protein [Novosphingobium sp.]
MSNYVYRLMERHRKVDDALRRAMMHPAADPREIARLKKLKLAVKDHLARLMRARASPA